VALALKVMALALGVVVVKGKNMSMIFHWGGARLKGRRLRVVVGFLRRGNNPLPTS